MAAVVIRVFIMDSLLRFGAEVFAAPLGVRTVDTCFVTYRRFTGSGGGADRRCWHREIVVDRWRTGKTEMSGSDGLLILIYSEGDADGDNCAGIERADGLVPRLLHGPDTP
jgi:hypothetical protein